MSLLDRILDEPSYGFRRDDVLYVPSRGELLREFAGRMNFFGNRHNWLPFFSWFMSLSLAVPLYFFFTEFFSWKLAAAGFVYSMVVLGSHGTFWLHRYSTHRAFKFKNAFIRTICRNLVIRIIPEEIYVISHHVHHRVSEQPGDPYNVHGGWLYCFLADANHQTLAKNLTEKEYASAAKLMSHTGVRLNSYAEYKKWGSLCHPAFAIGHYLLNWAFWFGTFYLIGGMPLAIALFGWAGVWGIGVRTYNFDGHGGGKDKRREGSDFNREDLSVNQTWPGYVAGEWHNNHHLYPTGARSGFLPHQIDLPWYFIWGLSKLGLAWDLKDPKSLFYRDHYRPYLASKCSRQRSQVTERQVKTMKPRVAEAIES